MLGNEGVFFFVDVGGSYEDCQYLSATVLGNGEVLYLGIVKVSMMNIVSAGP